MTKKSNMTNETKLYYVFSKAKAIKLREKGFDIVVRKPNYQYPEYDMYGFEDTPAFRKTFEEVTGCKYITN